MPQCDANKNWRTHLSLMLVAASAARQSEKFASATGMLSILRQHMQRHLAWCKCDNYPLRDKHFTTHTHVQTLYRASLVVMHDSQSRRDAQRSNWAGQHDAMNHSTGARGMDRRQLQAAQHHV